MRAARLIALTLVGVALTGCAPQSGVDPDMTSDKAKAIAQAGELEIAALVPEELVTETVQQPTGALLSCEGDRNFVWAGGTVVHLVEGTSAATIEGIISDIADTYAERDGWKATPSAGSSSGDPQVSLDGPDGDGYLVSGEADNLVIDIDSYSPCFHLRDDQSPFDEY